MRQCKKEDYRCAPYKKGKCEKCRKIFLRQSWNKYCVNCSYGNIAKRKMRALLTEEQALDLLDIQHKMMDVNQAIVDKMDADELAREKQELEELRTRVYQKYFNEIIGKNEKALRMETHPQGPGIVRVGSSTGI